MTSKKLTEKKYEELRRGILNDNLHVHALGAKDEEFLHSVYETILNETVKEEIPLKSFVLDTSNVLKDKKAEQLSLADLADEEDKEAWAKYADPNEEKADTTFIAGNDGFKPGDTPDDVIDATNLISNVWAIIPHDKDLAKSRMLKYNFLTPEIAMEIMNDIGYTHEPLSLNCVKDVVAKKIGQGRPTTSSYGIGNGRLKRELALQSVIFTGKNIQNDKDGFFKTVFGLKMAYLSDYKDLDAITATKLLKDHFKSLGYDDIQFNEGYIGNYTYSATYSSKKLGEALAKRIGLPAVKAEAIFVFETSDFGLSSLKITPILEATLESGLFKVQEDVRLQLAETISLAHIYDDMELSWKDKCGEVFATINNVSNLLNDADKVAVKYPVEALNNILKHIGQRSDFEGKEDILDQFKEDHLTDCTQRDLFVFASRIIGAWKRFNQAGATVAYEKLVRIVIAENIGKFDLISA